MKKFIIFTALFLSLCGHAQAVENGINVPYSRSVPSLIRYQAPRGSVTRFFGTCGVESLHANLFIHLYQPKKYLVGVKINSVPQSLYWLDIFVKKNKRLTKIQHIIVEGSECDREFGARLMWLDAKQQKIPILMLKVYNAEGFYGGTTSFHLFVFSPSLNHKATTQIFSDYGDHNETTSYKFDQLDERGFMAVTQIHQESGDKPTQENTLRWDGKKFSGAQTQAK